MKVKKLKKWKKYSEKNPQNYHGPMSAKSDKKTFIYSKSKKKTKLSWPMSAKSDT